MRLVVHTLGYMPHAQLDNDACAGARQRPRPWRNAIVDVVTGVLVGKVSHSTTRVSSLHYDLFLIADACGLASAISRYRVRLSVGTDQGSSWKWLGSICMHLRSEFCDQKEATTL